MTTLEVWAVVIFVVCFLVSNIAMYLQKGALYESKHLWLYFGTVKATVIAPALYTIVQLYVFAFEFVGAVGNDMYHMVYYCYLGYLILAGFIFFMEEMQVNLLRIMSGLLLAYQCLMGYILIANQKTLMVLGDSPMNPFANGQTMGIFLCLLGPIMSLAAFATVWHYWRGNNKHDFTPN